MFIFYYKRQFTNPNKVISPQNGQFYLSQIFGHVLNMSHHHYYTLHARQHFLLGKISPRSTYPRDFSFIFPNHAFDPGHKTLSVKYFVSKLSSQIITKKWV